MADAATEMTQESVDSLFALLGKGVSAVSQQRLLRAAEYFGRAASAARTLYGNKVLSVVLAHLQQSTCLAKHAQVSAWAADAAAADAAQLWVETRPLLAECRRILCARLSDNTCLLVRCFAVEEDFYARYAILVVGKLGVTSGLNALCERTKRELGYDTCMQATYNFIGFAYPAAAFGAQPSPLTGKERKEAQAFALRCVGIMATATHQTKSPMEVQFAEQIRDLLTSNYLEEPFKTELTHAWERPALQNTLRARGVFQVDEVQTAMAPQLNETLNINVVADRAKHGLRWCALPSCAKQEMCVFDFKACSACKAVVYCSAEHGALHWTQGHRKSALRSKRRGRSRAARRTRSRPGPGGT